MNEQGILVGVVDERPWRLDDHTREIGRRGVQEARAALRRSVVDEGRRTRPTAA